MRPNTYTSRRIDVKGGDELKEIGIGTIAALAVTVLVLGGGTAVSTVMIDTSYDQLPDEALYRAERIGEGIKEPVYVRYMDRGDEWYIERSSERMKEFLEMAEKGKAKEHLYLIEESENDFRKAMKHTESFQMLQTARERIENHIGVLEDLKEEVPENALQGITKAIEESSKVKKVLENVHERLMKGPWEGPGLPENVKQELEEIGKPSPPKPVD